MKKLILTLLFTFCATLFSFSQNFVVVAWDANPETDIGGYNVYYSTNSLIPPTNFLKNIVTGTNTLTNVINVIPYTLYSINVTAFNTNSLESDFSRQIRYEGLILTGYTNNLSLLGSTNWGSAILSGAPKNGYLSGTPPNVKYILTNLTAVTDNFKYTISENYAGGAITNYYSVSLTKLNSPPHIRLINLPQ